MFGCGIVGYTLHATMYAFDPGFQVVESYTWMYNIFEFLTIFLVTMIVLVLGLFMLKVYIVWPTLITRHRVAFQFSIYFIFCFFLCNFFWIFNPSFDL